MSTTGAVGGVASTANVLAWDSAEVVFPAAVAMTLCGPSPNATGWMKLHPPEASAVVLPTAVPSTLTVTVLPAAARPV
nr:hypothetical protein [Pyxidicoccus caerfyrddinensis]